MPAYLRGQFRDVLTFVRLSATGLLFYGWNAKDMTGLAGVTEADLIALGHLSADTMSAVAGAVAIIGANSPKPARATKRLVRNPNAGQQGSASTFVGGASYATAAAAGWNVSTGVRNVTFTQNQRTTTLAAQVEGGGFYCFPCNTNDAPTLITELGLQSPEMLTATERSLCFTGTSKPRPPTAEKELEAGTQSTFCSFDAIDDAAAAGWTVKGGMSYIVGAAVAP